MWIWHVGPREQVCEKGCVFAHAHGCTHVSVGSYVCASAYGYTEACMAHAFTPICAYGAGVKHVSLNVNLGTHVFMQVWKYVCASVFVNKCLSLELCLGRHECVCWWVGVCIHGGEGVACVYTHTSVCCACVHVLMPPWQCFYI